MLLRVALENRDHVGIKRSPRPAQAAAMAASNASASEHSSSGIVVTHLREKQAVRLRSIRAYICQVAVRHRAP